MNVIPTWFKGLLIGALVGFVLHQVYEAGAENERSQWVLKQALQTVSNQVELAKKNRDLRVLENRLVSSAIEISTFHQGVMNEKLAKKDRVIAGLNNRTVSLSIPVTSTGNSCQVGNSSTAANQSETAGTQRAELSREAAEFLVNFGHECDAVTIESNEVKDHLAACRAALVKQQSILKE